MLMGWIFENNTVIWRNFHGWWLVLEFNYLQSLGLQYCGWNITSLTTVGEELFTYC